MSPWSLLLCEYKRVSRLHRLVSTIKIGVHLFYDNKPDGDQALIAKVETYVWFKTNANGLIKSNVSI